MGDGVDDNPTAPRVEILFAGLALGWLRHPGPTTAPRADNWHELKFRLHHKAQAVFVMSARGARCVPSMINSIRESISNHAAQIYFSTCAILPDIQALLEAAGCTCATDQFGNVEARAENADHVTSSYHRDDPEHPAQRGFHHYPLSQVEVGLHPAPAALCSRVVAAEDMRHVMPGSFIADSGAVLTGQQRQAFVQAPLADLPGLLQPLLALLE